MIRQVLTIAALSAVILTPVMASAQPRGYPRGGGYARDRGGPPPRAYYEDRRFDDRRAYDRRYDAPRGDRGPRAYRDPRRDNDPRCGGGGSGGIIGAIAGGLLGSGGRAIERYDGRGC